MRLRRAHGSDELTGAGVLVLMCRSHDELSGADFSHQGKCWGKGYFSNESLPGKNGRTTSLRTVEKARPIGPDEVSALIDHMRRSWMRTIVGKVD